MAKFNRKRRRNGRSRRFIKRTGRKSFNKKVERAIKNLSETKFFIGTASVSVTTAGTDTTFPL